MAHCVLAPLPGGDVAVGATFDGPNQIWKPVKKPGPMSLAERVKMPTASKLVAEPRST